MDIRFSYHEVPTIRRFAQSDAFIRGLIGPVGGGKSSGCIAEFPRRAQNQKPSRDGVRRTRWAVVRNTYAELRDTTIQTFHRWLPPEHFGRWYASDHRYVVKAFDRCEFEVLFRALDRPEDIKKLLSLDLTGGWINEAREIPWAIVEALQGRCGRYPPQDEGGPTWSGIWLDTNPPDADSEFYKFFEDQTWRKDFDELVRIGGLPHGIKRPEDYAAIFRQPSGLSAQAENLPNLPNGYYARLAIGKGQEWKKVYIDGQYGFVTDDKAVFPEYRDEIHLKEIDPIPGRPIMRTWDFGLCYSDDTEVLTADGWKLFGAVDCERDMIATRDPVSGEMVYAKAAFKIAKPYKGEMLEWSSTELNLCVTPEHRVPFTYRDTPGKVHWQSAEWLAQHMGGHHYVDLLSKWSANKNRGAHWIARGDGYGLEEPTVFAQFMGLYLSEGSTRKGSISIYQRVRRPDMQAILDATGLKWKWREGGKAAGWYTWEPSVAEYLRQFGKAAQKFVPWHIKQMAPSAIQAFIFAYTAGDGHIRRRANGAEEHTIFTTSERMAGDMQELAQKAGWNSSTRKVKPQISVLEGRTIKNTGGYSITFKKTASRAELLKKNFRRVEYDGIVYCLSVPHHTLYVRRNGKPSWNGNTPACGFSQVLPSGQWLLFDEMIATSMGIDRFSDQVLEHCSRCFRGRDILFEDYGDPAGQQRAQTDERTCFEILHAKGVMIEPAEQTLAIRLESMRKPLRLLINGEPALILNPRCKVTRKAFLGGYHYRRMATNAERYSTEPEKNHPYSDLMDGWEYGASILFGGGLTGSPPQDDYPQMPQSEAGRSSITGY